MRHRWRWGSEAALVAELEAFLGGRYAEHTCDRSGRAPSWVWSNLLAHGTASQLARVREQRSPADQHRVWRHARSYLAAELLGLIELGHLDLVELQREVLIPLELEAMGRARRWRTPRDMVHDVVLSLDLAQQRRSRERRNRSVGPLGEAPRGRPTTS